MTSFLTNSFLAVTNTTIGSGGGVNNTVNFIPVPHPRTASRLTWAKTLVCRNRCRRSGPGGLYQLIGSDFTATLQAIAAAGKAQVLSRPSILAHDGQMAEIVIGQSVYLPSSVTLSAVGGTGTTVPAINGTYQNVGIQLDVTPFIGQNNFVEMVLERKSRPLTPPRPARSFKAAACSAPPCMRPISTNAPPIPWW